MIVSFFVQLVLNVQLLKGKAIYMNDKENYSNDKSKRGFVTELYEWIDALVFAIVAVVLVFSFAVRVTTVSGPSMKPTLSSGDKIILTNFNYIPKAKDIVVLSHQTSKDQLIIKRIIAVEGQTVDINFSTGDVFVDGVKQVEPYINEPTATNHGMKFPLTVEKGKLFVMGDNRNDSLDSRSTEIGLIDTRYILGKATYRIYPFNTFGKLQ